MQNNPIDFVDPTGLFKLAKKDDPKDDGPPIRIEVHGDPWDWGWWHFYFDSLELMNPPHGDPGRGGEPGGGGIHNVPEPEKQEKNDCMTLVSEVNRLAGETGNRRLDFMKALKERFVNSVNRDPTKRRERYSEFTSKGFKEQFTDNVGPDNSPNQVYHYVGTFEAGFVAGDVLGSTLGFYSAIVVANNHEREYNGVDMGDGKTVSILKPTTPSHQADMRLNEVSVNHGALVGSGAIRPNELGALIEKDVCNH